LSSMKEDILCKSPKSHSVELPYGHAHSDSIVKSIMVATH
jgi:hypothetical protein